MTTVPTYPSFNSLGINDNSNRAVPLVDAPLSQHTPLFAILSKMGRGGVNVIPANNFTALYGDNTLDPNSDYFTHQSEAVATAISAGNSTIAIKRIIPKGARTASCTLGIDREFPDEWFMGDVETAMVTGTYTPILDVYVDNEGEWGNSYGFSITPVEDYEARILGVSDDISIYRFQLLKVDEFTLNSTVIPNNLGDFSTLVSFKPGVTNRTGTELFIETRLKELYGSGSDDTSVPILGKVKFYTNNYLNLITTSSNYDESLGPWKQDLNSLFGVELIMFEPFSNQHHFQFTGGSDGLEADMVSYITRRLERVRVYDEGVQQFFASLTEDNLYTDPAKYPYSIVYDTGFTYDTKLAMRTLMNTRRDVMIVASCFTYADYVDDNKKVFDYIPMQSEESIQATGAKLQSAFRLYPESYKFGTMACRTLIVKNSGVINNSAYRKRRSLAIALVEKLSKYMGSGTGEWRQEYAIDTETNRVIAGWSELDVGYQSPTLKQLNSDNGLTYVDTLDTNRFYIPYYQTIYDDHTSILRDFITVCACCWLEKLGMLAWRRYSGDGSVGDNKRKERIAKFLTDRTKNAFDNRVTITPVIDDLQSQSGNMGENIVLHVYASKTKTSNIYTIETNRMADLV